MTVDATRRGAGLALLALLAACVSAPEAPPPAPPPPPPTPAPTPVPVAPAQAWDVAPVQPGSWGYKREPNGESVARFGTSEAAPIVTLRCRRAAGQVALSLLAVQGPARTIAIRTSNGDLQWPGAPDGAGFTLMRPANDRGLDWIAFSRGRFAIEGAGLPRLIVPAWAEVARVIEDCRG